MGNGDALHGTPAERRGGREPPRHWCRPGHDAAALAGAPFAVRWRAAVRNLRLGAARLQAAAGDLPLYVALADDHRLHPDPAGPLRRHQQALDDYTAALACVQALLREHDVHLA